MCVWFSRKKEKKKKGKVHFVVCGLCLVPEKKKRKEEATFSIKGFILNVEHQKKKKYYVNL